MDNKTIHQQLSEINEKLNFISEEMRQYHRRHQEWEELKDDLNRIAKDFFQVAVEELDEVAQHFDTRDLLFLLKKLLRNIRTINRLVDKLESWSDFVEDATPLSKEMFNGLMMQLDELDKKGFFQFMEEVLKIVDTIITSFSVEDVRLLRENITFILLTIKNLTQPEMLGTINNMVGFYKQMDIVVAEDISLIKLLKELKDPQTRRGLAFMIQFLKNMASGNGQLNFEETKKLIKEGGGKNGRTNHRNDSSN